jgi:hypothetical protein
MGRYLALVPMALALAACGGGGGGGGGLSLDPVASAAQRTSKAGSIRFTMHLEAGVPSGNYIAFTARGFSNNADGSGRFSYVFFGAGKPKFHATAVFDGSTFYVKSKAFASKLPDGKTWIKITEKEFKEAGVSFDEAQQGTPTQSLKALRAAGHTVKVGRATVRGVPTTRYHAVVDLEKEKLADKMGMKRLPVNAWIDRKGELRKFTFAVSSPDPTKSGKFSFLLTGFGPAKTVASPPSDQTVDIRDVKG